MCLAHSEEQLEGNGRASLCQIYLGYFTEQFELFRSVSVILDFTGDLVPFKISPSTEKLKTLKNKCIHCISVRPKCVR